MQDIKNIFVPVSIVVGIVAAVLASVAWIQAGNKVGSDESVILRAEIAAMRERIGVLSAQQIQPEIWKELTSLREAIARIETRQAIKP